MNQNRKSFNRKILTTIIPTISAVFIICSTIIYIHLKNYFENEGIKTLQLLASDFAHKLETEFIAFTTIERQFNTVFSNFEKINVNDRRTFFVDLAHNIISENEKITGLWADFDKNAIDGRDAQFKFVGVFPRSGRFNFCWHRFEGTLSFIEEHPEKLVEDLLNEPYYSLAREKKKTVFVEPYYDNYSGLSSKQQSNGVFITSIVSPVFRNDTVIGVTGIDISLPDYIRMANEITVYNSGYVLLYSTDGKYLAHSDSDLIGKSILDNRKYDSTFIDSVFNKILAKKGFSLDFINFRGIRMLYYYHPINIGIPGSELMLSIAVPYSEIIAEANQTLAFILVLFIIILTFGIVLTIINSKKISKPLKKLTAEAQKIINGDLSFHFEDNNSSKELNSIATAMITVNQTIQMFLSEISRIIFAATQGRLNTWSDSTKFKGVYSDLMEEINEMISMFREPLSMMADVVYVVEYPSLKFLSVTGDNQAGLEIDASDFIDKTVKEMFPAESADKLINQVEIMLKEHFTGILDIPKSTVEISKLNKDGSTIWLEVVFKILFNAANRPNKIIMVARNINKRKEQELKLVESDKILTAITENSNDLIWIVDAKTMKYTFESLNSEFIHGYSAEDIKAGKRTFANSFSPETIQMINNIIVEKVAQFKRGEISSLRTVFEAPLLCKDGSTVWVEISASAILDAAGNPDEFYGVTRILAERGKNL